jgi:hypothetical protein
MVRVVRAAAVLLSWACALAGCGGAPDAVVVEAKPRPTSPPPKVSTPISEAAALYAKQHALELLPPDVQLALTLPPERPARVTLGPLEANEALVEDESGRLIFRAPPVTWSCLPNPRVAYEIARRADGSVVILRLVPKITVVERHVPGVCGVGCGPAPPAPMTPLHRLPATDRLSIESVPYEVTVENVTCDTPIPRP